MYGFLSFLFLYKLYSQNDIFKVEHILHPFSNVSIVDFERVKVSYLMLFSPRISMMLDILMSCLMSWLVKSWLMS